jgi:exosome complex RNA-binding protein Rrp4
VKVNKNIAISENGFIFNPGTGDSFSTNEIGQEVIRMLNEGKTRDEITDSILSRYEVERSILEKDLGDYFFMLGTYHIVQNDQ